MRIKLADTTQEGKRNVVQTTNWDVEFVSIQTKYELAAATNEITYDETTAAFFIRWTTIMFEQERKDRIVQEINEVLQIVKTVEWQPGWVKQKNTTEDFAKDEIIDKEIRDVK